MRNYSRDLMDKIQVKIKNGEYEVHDFADYDEMPMNIFINGARVVLCKDSNGRHDSYVTTDPEFTSKDLQTYKNDSLGYFYSKDWKRANKGEESFRKYHEMTMNLNNMEITILVRDLSAEEMNDEIIGIRYNDLKISSDKYMTVIKAFVTTEERYSSSSLLEEKLYVKNIMTGDSSTDVQEGEESGENSESGPDDVDTDMPLVDEDPLF